MKWGVEVVFLDLLYKSSVQIIHDTVSGGMGYYKCKGSVLILQTLKGRFMLAKCRLLNIFFLIPHNKYVSLGRLYF